MSNAIVWIRQSHRAMIEKIYRSVPVSHRTSKTEVASTAVKKYALESFRMSNQWTQLGDDYVTGKAKLDITPFKTKKGRRAYSARNSTVHLDEEASTIARRITQVSKLTLPMIVEDAISHLFYSVTET